LDQLQRKLQLPMILITHDPEDAAILGEEVLYLRDGAVETQAGGVASLPTAG
jgi:molybdate transport system ATP-binding protein